MLRGINRSIIEISETESKYFEKILFFVKPEFGSLPPERLDNEAKRMLGAISFTPVGLSRGMSARKRAQIKKRRKLVAAVLVLLTAAGIVLWRIF